ncbi:MAG: MotA/TolQ/ExbB proton channel family protein [Hyphomicrobiales bacterium]
MAIASERAPRSALRPRLVREPVAETDTSRPESPTAAAAFASRFVVLQAVAAAGVIGLWLTGIAGKPFSGANAILCWIILGIGILGLLCVFLQRWRDVKWIATHVVRLGLLGTVVGLIVAFSAAKSGANADPNEIRTMIAAVVDGMYVSLYATLLGISVNLWLKINMRLLGNIDG